MNTLGAAANRPKECVRRSEIPETIEELFNAIQCAEEQVSMLFNSIDPVVRPPEPTKDCGATASGYSTDLANRINSANLRIRSLADSVCSIRNRVEL